MAYLLAALLLPQGVAGALPEVLRPLDCDRDPRWQSWRQLYEKEGVTSERVMAEALNIWQTSGFDSLVPWKASLEGSSEQEETLEHLGAELDEEGRKDREDAEQESYFWRSRLQAQGPQMQQSLRFVNFMFASLLQGGGQGMPGWMQTLRELLEVEESDTCIWHFSPYAVLAMTHVIIYTLKQMHRRDLLASFKDQALATMEIVLDLPYHTYDFVDLAWNLSSFTVAANIVNAPESLDHYDTFEAYAEQHPVPPPYLPPWSFDVLESTLGSLGAKHQLLSAASAVGSVRVAVLHLHDATAWDDWSALQAAWASLFNDRGPELLPLFYFTHVKGLAGCREETLIRAHLQTDYAALRSLLESIRGADDVGLKAARDFLGRLWTDGALRNAEVLLCGEPVWLCPLLDGLARRPMMMRFNMAVLDEFLYNGGNTGIALREWWSEFHRMVSDGLVLTSVGTRFTVEQVAYQTAGAVRFPYVPFLGLELSARLVKREAASTSQVLLFHNNLPSLLTFRHVLKVVAASMMPKMQVALLDMNDLPRGMCRSDMAAFQAAVLLPHNPAPIRLIDLYTQGVPLFVPGEPLIHRWIWANRPFGGFSAPPAWQVSAQVAGFEGVFPKSSAVPPPAEHPPFSATAHLIAWGIHRHLADRRYWLQYTEWELLPGLQRFRSASELLGQLQELPQACWDDTRLLMNAHLQARRAEALAWWRAALASDGMVVFT